jgi:hypothetical protein
VRIALGLVAVCASACNWAFALEKTGVQPAPDAALRPDGDPRSDLDRDHVPDVSDPCIAPETDSLIDTDQDGVPNGMDGCPFDNKPSVDVDGDGVPDTCDPNPSVPGDRVRCVMAFSDPDLDVAMWKPRDMPMYPWTLWSPRILYGTQGSIVADWPFEGFVATTTFDIRVLFIFSFGVSTGTFAVMPRADATPSSSDVGCLLTIGNPDKAGAWTLDTIPPSVQSIFTTNNALTIAARFLVTVKPGAAGNNVSCKVQLDTGSFGQTAGHVTLPLGNLAFTTSEYVTVNSITIYERDDAPAL